jgi:hypothetical protein
MTAKSAMYQKFPRIRGIAWMASILAVSLLICGGCYVMRHDVDPQYRGATFSQLAISSQPQLVNIDVEYRLYGRNWKSMARGLRPKVVRALTSMHSFVEADETNRHVAGQLLIVVTPEQTPKLFLESIGKGIVTGATYGLVSTSIQQNYDMSVTYTPPNGQQLVRNYRHCVTTTTGIKAMVENENSVTGDDLADRVMEDMLVNFMYDIQTSPGTPNLGPTTAPQVAATNGETSVARLPAPVSPASATFPRMRPLTDTLNLPPTFTR